MKIARFIIVSCINFYSHTIYTFTIYLYIYIGYYIRHVLILKTKQNKEH